MCAVLLLTVPGGRVAMGGHDPISRTTFNQIGMPRILETKLSRVPLLFLAIFTSVFFSRNFHASWSNL